MRASGWFLGLEGGGRIQVLAIAVVLGWVCPVASGQAWQDPLTLPDLVLPAGDQVPNGKKGDARGVDVAVTAGDLVLEGIEVDAAGVDIPMPVEDGLADLDDYPTVDQAELPLVGEVVGATSVDGGLGLPEFALPVADGSVVDPLAGDLVMPIGGAEGGVPGGELGAGEALARGRRDHGIFKFTLGGSVIYDDNIFISAQEEVADVLYVISPGVSINLGDAAERKRSYLYLNYNPEVVFFQDTSEENAVDQSLEIGGAWKGPKLSVAATAGYQNLHGTTADAGGRADRQVFYGNLILGYGWGGKTSIETGFYYEQSDYGDLSDTREFRNESFVDYQLTGKTSVGLGAAFGRLDAMGAEGGGQDFQQLLLRGRSQIGAKLAISGRVGADFRQSEVGNDVTPVFGFGATYEPTSGTLVSFDASRDLSASASEDGEVYTRTAAELGIKQRFMRRWKLGLDGGVEQLEYDATTDVAEGGREETGYFVRPSVRYDFKQGMRGELFYLVRRNDSNDAEQSYESNQVGVSMGVDF